MYELNAVVDIASRAGRARSVKIVQSKHETPGFVTFEKNLEIVLALLGIGILLAVALWHHGFALHILGPIFGMLGAGYALGHLTQGVSNREERLDAHHYQSMADRLAIAQDQGRTPADLPE